jgi:diketogulonate reductase-like aldo/keto reductase
MSINIKNHIYCGTYTVIDETLLLSSLETAYKYGYRRIDTATLYKNQHIIGKFINTPEPENTDILETKNIKSYLTKRDSLWITSKVSFRVMPKGEVEIRNSIDKTLNDLQTHYIDLMLIHSPEKNDILTWKILCEYKEKGLIRNIGLSNYNLEKLKAFIENIDNPEDIYCNQIEFNPFLYRKELIDYCKSLNIKVVTYGNLYYSNYIIDAIAEKMNKTKEQILLRFTIQKELDIVIMATEEKYIKMNIDLDFIISEDDMDEIDEISAYGIYISKSKYKRFL